MQPNQLKIAHLFVSRMIYVLDDEMQSVNFCMIMLMPFLSLSLPSRKKKRYVELEGGITELSRPGFTETLVLV